MDARDHDPTTAVTQWFEERGFVLEFTADDDDGERFYWADLLRLPSRRAAAPMYGRGEN